MAPPQPKSFQGGAAPNPNSNRSQKKARQAKAEMDRQLQFEEDNAGISASESSATAVVQQATEDKPTEPLQNPEPIEEVEEDDVLVFSDVDEDEEHQAEQMEEDDDEPEIVTEIQQEAAAEVKPSLIRPLQAGELIEKDLPAAIADTNTWMYPASTAMWHTQTGGRDEPSPNLLKNARFKATKANVAITFRDHNQILFTSGSLRPLSNQEDADSMDLDTDNTKGGKGKGPALDPTPAEAAAAESASKDKARESKDKYHPVRLHWILNSQVPGFYLSVNRRASKDSESDDDDNTPVTVHFHVNNMKVKKAENKPDLRVCLTSGLGEELAKRLDPDSGMEAESKTSSGCLWGTDVELWKPGNLVIPELTNGAPQFCNISRDEMERIRVTGSGATPGDTTVLSVGDWVLYGLMTCTAFTMFRTWSKDDESVKVYDYFTKYMRTLLDEVALMGHFPFYARQANQQMTNLHSENFVIENAVPPRNMVTSWRVTYQGQTPVSAVAETWTAFTPLIAYPEARAKTFAMRLGIARTRPNELAAVQEAIDKFMGKVECTFMKLSQVGTYYGEIFLSNSEGKIFVENGVKPPVPNTRVTMEVTGGQFDGKKLAGVVVPDVYGRGRDICVSVYLKHGSVDFPEASTNVNVDLFFAALAATSSSRGKSPR